MVDDRVPSTHDAYLQPRAVSSHTVHSHLGSALLPLQRWVLAVCCLSRDVTAGEVCQPRHVVMQALGSPSCLCHNDHGSPVPLSAVVTAAQVAA